MKMDYENINWEEYFRQAEEICFDCGTTSEKLTVISKGVALCDDCLRHASYDYPKIKEER